MNDSQISILKKEIDTKIIDAIDSWEPKEGFFNEEYPLLDALFAVIDLYYSIKYKDENEEEFE